MWESFRERWYAFTIEQKVSVVILSFCGVFVVGMSLYRIQENVKAPFLVSDSQIIAAKKLIGPSDQETEDKLKRTDTDGDGLSDWDEINVYHTNPDLRDTCGDGIPDNIRVLTGKNLNCQSNTSNPVGIMDLTQVQASSGTGAMPAIPAEAAPSNNIDMTQLLQAASDASSTADTTGDDSSADTSNDSMQGLPRDATAIRAALQGSVDPAKLSEVSDDELLQLYDEAKQEASQPNATPQTATDTNPAAIQQ